MGDHRYLLRTWIQNPLAVELVFGGMNGIDTMYTKWYSWALYRGFC